MQSTNKVTGMYSDGTNQLEVSLPLILFEEDGAQIAYCPALEVSGYGDTEDVAWESFKVCLGEFLQYTLRKKTFRKVMEQLGWTVRKSLAKPMTPPSMEQLLRENDNFNRVFNNYAFRKVNRNVMLPA